MKLHGFSFVRRVLKDERGQAIVLVGAILAAFLALSALSIDVGHGYFAYQSLQASTNSAALAGAAGLPDTSVATSYVTLYSAAPGGKNASAMLQNATVTPTFLCLSTVTTNFKAPCITSTGASGGYNSVKVTQTAKVPLWFGGLLGVKTFNLSATATAAMKGGNNTPWNIAIVLDATPSMNYSDSGVQCSGTQESCALQGVQALLGDLYPCYLGQTCTNSGSTAVNSVSLFVFPPFKSTTAPYAYCSGGSPSNIQDGYYIVPNLTSTYTYQITGFSNDYKTSDSASTLSTSSNIVKATGYSGSGCAGIKPPTTQWTYFAQVIYTAQAALAAQQAANSTSKNAMIILSDGDATAGSGLVYTKTCTTDSWGHQTCKNTGVSSTSSFQPSSTSPYSLNGLSFNNPTDPTYPSVVGECGQAVVAANAAAKAGTQVYTIGYGANTYGCDFDQNYSASLTTGGGSWGPGSSPCDALGAMASNAQNFYSDNANGCSATTPTNAAITKLAAIFNQIAGNFTTPRLIPNGTT